MVTLGVQVAERPETDIQGRAGSDQVCVRALAKSNSIHMFKIAYMRLDHI